MLEKDIGKTKCSWRDHPYSHENISKPAKLRGFYSWLVDIVKCTEVSWNDGCWRKGQKITENIALHFEGCIVDLNMFINCSFWLSWPVMVRGTVEMEKSAFANWIQFRNLAIEWHMEAEYLIDSGDTFNFYLTWMYFLCLLFHFPQTENSHMPFCISVEYITFPILVFAASFSELFLTPWLLYNKEQNKNCLKV